jgi:hypothetical protein
MVISALLSVVAIVLAVAAFAQLDSQVDRAKQLSDFNTEMLEVTQKSRVKSAVEFCKETESIKAGIRGVLNLSEQLNKKVEPPPGVTREELERAQREAEALFKELDCEKEAERLIRPLPPLPKPR